jgi:hypothetical protein
MLIHHAFLICFAALFTLIHQLELPFTIFNVSLIISHYAVCYSFWYVFITIVRQHGPLILAISTIAAALVASFMAMSLLIQFENSYY